MFFLILDKQIVSVPSFQVHEAALLECRKSLQVLLLLRKCGEDDLGLKIHEMYVDACAFSFVCMQNML